MTDKIRGARDSTADMPYDSPVRIRGPAHCPGAAATAMPRTAEKMPKAAH
jgi:hypothetical protein